MNNSLSIPRFRIILIITLMMATVSVEAQIAIAPTMLFVHDETSVGEIYLTNTSSVTQEINFTYQFGYPSSSSNGEIFMIYDDSVRQKQWGLGERIRMFPGQVIIEPGQSQTVRVQVMPMRDRQDGVYWTRLLVASSAITPDVQETDTDGISTNINYVLEQNIPVFFRKGDNSTGIMVTETDMDEKGDSLIVKANVQRTGNSPYLGMMYATVYAQNGEKLAKKEAPAYFYFNDWRTFTFRKSDFREAPYRIEFEFETKRRALNSGDIVNAEKQTHSVGFME